MKLTIAVLPGDGIGPEVIKQSKKVLEAIAHQFNHTFIFKEGLIGAAAIEKEGVPLPQKTLDLCFEADAVLFGAVGTRQYDNDPTFTVRPEHGLLQLRKSLGLYCSIRPVKVFEQLLDKSPLKREIVHDVDFQIYRELAGGMYYGEKIVSKDKKTASDVCEYTEQEVEKITHLAFKAAQKRRKKVTLVDKANILESSRLWRQVVLKVAKQYKDVALNFLFIDNASIKIITNPREFDIILTQNMFGDILSNEASVLECSIGLMASAEVGEKYALFKPIHGSYSLAKGKSIANPIASILSAAMLLENFGLFSESEMVQKAINKSLDLQIITSDINKNSNFSTAKVGDFIADVIYYPDDSDMNFNNIHIGQSTII